MEQKIGVYETEEKCRESVEGSGSLELLDADGIEANFQRKIWRRPNLQTQSLRIFWHGSGQKCTHCQRDRLAPDLRMSSFLQSCLSHALNSMHYHMKLNRVAPLPLVCCGNYGQMYVVARFGLKFTNNDKIIIIEILIRDTKCFGSRHGTAARPKRWLMSGKVNLFSLVAKN